MPRKTDSHNPGDWLWIAARDLEALEAMAAQELGYELCRSKLAEVLEKIFKAELLRQGWVLEKTHDLRKLGGEVPRAIRYSARKSARWSLLLRRHISRRVIPDSTLTIPIGRPCERMLPPSPHCSRRRKRALARNRRDTPYLRILRRFVPE